MFPLTHLLARGCGKAVAAGMNPMDLRKGIKLATDQVVSVLSDISKPISTKEEVAQVGTISANRCDDISVFRFVCEEAFLGEYKQQYRLSHIFRCSFG